MIRICYYELFSGYVAFQFRKEEAQKTCQQLNDMYFRKNMTDRVMLVKAMPAYPLRAKITRYSFLRYSCL